MRAMQRAVANLPLVPGYVLVDGNRTPVFGIPALAVVKGRQQGGRDQRS